MPAVFRSADLGDGVRALTLSNPARKNALDEVGLEQLREVLSAPDRAQVRCWLIRSEGEGPFSSGYDLKALSAVGADRLPDEVLGDVFDLLQQQPAPSVALLTGAAFGAGCELACACDFRVGDARAAFCLPPMRVGVVYAPRGIRRIAALTGLGRAKYMLLSGRKIDCDEARLFGLLDGVHAVGEAEAGALALCRELALGAPLALSGMKKIFGRLERGALGPGDEAEFEGLRRAAFNSDDAREGRDAFLQRRAPKFSGR